MNEWICIRINVGIRHLIKAETTHYRGKETLLWLILSLELQHFITPDSRSREEFNSCLLKSVLLLSVGPQTKSVLLKRLEMPSTGIIEKRAVEKTFLLFMHWLANASTRKALLLNSASKVGQSLVETLSRFMSNRKSQDILIQFWTQFMIKIK